MKTINLKNTQIIEATLTDKGISVAYSILDDNNNEVFTKRATIVDFTKLQQDKIDDIFSLIISKIKKLEQLT